MRRISLALMLLLAGCGEKSAEVAGEASDAAQPKAGQAAVASQIAYRYSRTYRIADGVVAQLQDQHIALCEQLGPTRCHLLGQEQDSDDGGAAATLALAVAAGEARPLLTRIDGAADRAGAEVGTRGATAENLTRAIIDTEARIRAKEALTRRLLTLLETRKGGIADAVAAEKAFAEAQADLEAAQAQLAAMRGQVAMSRIDIAYQAPPGVVRTLRTSLLPALGEATGLLATSIGVLLRLLIVLGPWLGLVALIVWLRGRARRPVED